MSEGFETLTKTFANRTSLKYCDQRMYLETFQALLTYKVDFAFSVLR